MKLNLSFVKKIGRCEIWIDNYESQIVTLENEFDNNEDRIVHFEVHIATCEAQIVNFAVQFSNVENQFALFWYDHVFVSTLYVRPATHSGDLARMRV